VNKGTEAAGEGAQKGFWVHGSAHNAEGEKAALPKRVANWRPVAASKSGPSSEKPEPPSTLRALSKEGRH
jgi:hypothetical protein